MAENRDAKQPTHRAYSVIKRESMDDFWLNLGLVFPHKDGSGFNIMLQAFPLDGKVVCRVITADDVPEESVRQREQTERPSGTSRRSR